MAPPNADMVAVGVDYCTKHHGIRNEDEHFCDMRMEWSDTTDTDDPCDLHQLYYLSPNEQVGDTP